MENFLPEGYKIPSNSRYMKLQDGENTFRVLSSAVLGWSYWNTSNKPVRLKERPDEMPHDIRVESDKQPKVKHFWAFVVWNYAENMIQVLEVTQGQIQSGITALVKSKHWGNPTGYDINVSRSGSGYDTEYVVQGIPPTPVDAKVAKEYQKLKIDLTALFRGEDPFGGAGAEAQTAPVAAAPSAADEAPLPREMPGA